MDSRVMPLTNIISLLLTRRNDLLLARLINEHNILI